MKKNKFSGLRWKITLYIFLGAILFSAVVLYVTYRYVNIMLTDSLLEEGRIVGANIAELAAEKLIEDDMVALKSVIEKYKYYSNIEYILIEDFNNNIKTDTYNGNVPEEIINGHVYDESNDNMDDMVKRLDIRSQNEEIYDILQPIKEGLLGFVRVGMKKSYVDGRIRETMFYLSLVFIVGTFLAIILAIFIITLQITRPIAYLTNSAYKISMGEFNVPVKVNVRNEIGILAEAVERMRESLKTSIDRLRQK